MFIGVLDARARDINIKKKLKATRKLAELVKNNLSKERIIPEVFNREVSY